MTLVKICGLTTTPDLDAAIEAGADFVGFVHFERSPRHVSSRLLSVLVDHVPVANRRYGRNARSVALVVNASDDDLEFVDCTGVDLVQFHGNETAESIGKARRDRVQNAGTIKAVPTAGPDDVRAAEAFRDVVEHVMFDAKPSAGSDRPGGHGVTFDWRVFKEATQPGWPEGPAFFPPLVGPDDNRLWFLAGGLTPGNVAEAIRVTGAPAVDVSSGVESAPGVKDPALIRAFVQAIRNAS